MPDISTPPYVSPEQWEKWQRMLREMLPRGEGEPASESENTSSPTPDPQSKEPGR